MLRHVLLLLFLFGIKNCDSSDTPQEEPIESKDVLQDGIKKNEVSANGHEANWEKITRNFRNPVLEYLLLNNSERTKGLPQKGVVREIRHSQTLFVPNFPASPLLRFLFDQLPQFEAQKKSTKQGTRNPENSPFDNFWNFLKNKTQSGGEKKIQESVVSSPVLHLHKNLDEIKEESTRIETYPAVGVVINTFSKDGTLKSTVTHFQPDFNSMKFEINGNEAINAPGEKNPPKDYNNALRSQYRVNNFLKGMENEFSKRNHIQDSRQGTSWTSANYFPTDKDNPFLSLYSAVSSMVEYAPSADTCLDEKEKTPDMRGTNQQRSSSIREKLIYKNEPTEYIFDEVTMRSEVFRRKPTLNKYQEGVIRKRRDATSIFVQSRQGDSVGITLEEPSSLMNAAVQDERVRSFSQTLVNTPPLSTILRPPQQEPRQFLGYADKRRKTKPSKPIKEESNSEEVGEEHEEESSSQSPESANEGVAISPPPEGASVAEAKPIGLAIAGPGGVAASKPQGTAVAGPGGLAIARPVGTAIAGVDVEGSVPIGGQQKNKKKPKQEQEQTEGELHYVGGLTGPIGNPQPKEFADSIYYKTVKDTEGNNIQENFLFRRKPNINGFQLRLGQQNGKYGFVPMLSNPIEGEGVAQKRTDFPIFFHGLLGNNAPEFDRIQNFQTQF